MCESGCSKCLIRRFLRTWRRRRDLLQIAVQFVRSAASQHLDLDFQIPPSGKKKTTLVRVWFFFLAEKERFELSKPFWGLHDFQLRFFLPLFPFIPIIPIYVNFLHPICLIFFIYLYLHCNILQTPIYSGFSDCLILFPMFCTQFSASCFFICRLGFSRTANFMTVK